MAPNSYDSCPCGSGKKFKWCCAPYFDKIEQALDLAQQGQHESAVRMMESVASEHPNYPPVWSYYAHLLFTEGNYEKAEEVLEKGFALDPNFPMGYFLRGLIRHSEGELIGSLMLFRKAAEAFDPQAHFRLAQVYEIITRCELMLQRVVAARAAMDRACYFSQNDPEIREMLDGFFGDTSRLPACARKKYTFRRTVKPVSADSATGRLSDAKKAFEDLTQLVPDDPAGWFNLGLVRAWLGEQPAAVEALQKSLELEWDDDKAEETAALTEVLRLAQGMESDSDYLEHRIFMPIRDGRAVSQWLRAMSEAHRIVGSEVDQERHVFSCMIVEELPSLLDTGTTMSRVVANLLIADNVLRLWNRNPENVKQIAQEIRDRINLAVGEPVEGVGPAQFGDIVQEALSYPTRVSDVAAAETKLRDRAAHYYEDVWANQPLRSLGSATPLDAVGSKLLRKRLLGIIKFLEDCMVGSVPQKEVDGKAVSLDVYDFSRLRHKLGAEKQPPGEAPVINVPVETKAAPTPSTPAPAATAPEKRDFSAMSAADLASVPLDQLSVLELEDAMRAALKLDARELAVRFAQIASTKPFDASKPDRYPFFACLITGAISEGDTAAAIQHAEAGAKYDAEHNTGKRANEFSVRKGQLLARRGETDAAVKEFEDLLNRNPDEPKFYITATEAMLSAKQGEKALQFAERGLAKARSSNNRDLEGACLELSEAARRQMK